MGWSYRDDKRLSGTLRGADEKNRPVPPSISAASAADTDARDPTITF